MCVVLFLSFSSPALPVLEGTLFHGVQCGDDDENPSVSSATGSLWSSILNVGAMIGALSGPTHRPECLDVCR